MVIGRTPATITAAGPEASRSNNETHDSPLISHNDSTGLYDLRNAGTRRRRR